MCFASSSELEVDINVLSIRFESHWGRNRAPRHILPQTQTPSAREAPRDLTQLSTRVLPSSLAPDGPRSFRSGQQETRLRSPHAPGSKHVCPSGRPARSVTCEQNNDGCLAVWPSLSLHSLRECSLTSLVMLRNRTLRHVLLSFSVIVFVFVEGLYGVDGVICLLSCSL